MGSRNIFLSPTNDKLRAYHSKLRRTEGSWPDSIALLNVYQTWKNYNIHATHEGRWFEEEWAKRFSQQ